MPSTWRLTTAQAAFVASSEPYARCVGSIGSGKSIAGAVKAQRYALSNPGSLGLAMAPTSQQVQQVLIPTLLNLLDETQISYWDAVMGSVLFTNQSLILFRAADDLDSLRSRNLAWVWIDDADRVAEEVKVILRTRLRQSGYPHQMWVTETAIPVYDLDA